MTRSVTDPVGEISFAVGASSSASMNEIEITVPAEVQVLLDLEQLLPVCF